MCSLVITEKPSAAQSIANVISATQRHDGYLEGNGYACTGKLAPSVSVESKNRNALRKAVVLEGKI